MTALIKTGILLIFFLGNASFKPAEHPIKMSTCIVTCEPEKGELQLAFHFFQDDFGEHLSRLYQKEITFDQHTEMVNNAIRDYVIRHFSFFVDDKEMELKWKKAYKKDLVEYVEFFIMDCGCSLPKQIKVNNTLLLDAFEKQSNIVRIDLRGDNNFTTLRFNKNETSQERLLK